MTISLSSSEHITCSEFESGRRSVRSTGDVTEAHNLFKRMPGLPQEHADVSNVFIVAWTGKLCALDSAQSSKRRVTNRCGIVPLELSVGTDRDGVTNFQPYILDLRPARPGPP